MATNPAKERYIQRIRSESAYPTFRSLINLFAILLYLVAVIFIVGGLFAGLAAMSQQGAQGIGLMIGGFILGVIYYVIGRVTKEAAFMLADVADCLTDQNSRCEKLQESAVRE